MHRPLLTKSLYLVQVLILLLAGISARSQTTLTTVSTGTGLWSTNGGAMTFGLTNNNPYAIIITDLASFLPATTVTATYSLWYHPTQLTGPVTISAANGWVQVPQTVTLTTAGPAGITPIFSNLSLTIPANTSYRMAFVTSASGPYYGNAGGNVLTSAGGVDLHSGLSTISPTYYGAFPTPPNNTLARYFYGTITFAPAVPCNDPPTAGSATISSATVCQGNSFTLNLTGNTGGTGQTYQWQSSATLAGPYTNIGSSSGSSSYTSTATTNMYYQALVTCGASTVPSVPIGVTVPPLYPGGTYSINASLPTSGTNFHSFTDAFSAIACGISGPVVFDVDSASGPYNEQVSLPAIGSVVNTITINGNGATLTFASANAGAPHTFMLNGTDYVTVNNLRIEGTGATYALACHLWNNADNNAFNNCYFGVPANGTATTQVPFSLSGVETVATTAGPSGNNNIITGCTMFSGYYNTCIVGNSAGVNTGNQLINCHLLDYYFYGSYNLYQNGLIVRGNTIERPTRTTLSTFYGIYVLTGCINTLVERNTIRNPFGDAPSTASIAYGIYSSIDGSVGNENKYYNNLIYNINGNSTSAGMYMTGADHFKAYHNTISMDYTLATTGATYGIYATGTVGGKDIKDNIISITRGGSGTKHCLYFASIAPISDYNDLYITPAATNHVGFFVSNFTSLLNWQAANGGTWDQNSEEVDPMFASPLAGDMTPTNSLLDDQGTPVGITTDFFNNPRSGVTPDIGGIEFVVPPCNGQPTAGNLTSPAGACAGSNFTLTLSGYTIGTGISIAWESSPMGQSNWTPMTGTTPSIVTSITSSTDYRATVTCSAGGQSAQAFATVTLNDFYNCYCSPLTGVQLHTTVNNYIINVKIPGTTLNSTTSVAGPGGHMQFNPAIPSNTASLAIGVPYTLDVTNLYITNYDGAWIDYDHSGSFDATEFISFTITTFYAKGTILIPATALTGITGLRLRHGTAAVTSGGFCTVAGYETEDYLITILPQPSCLPPNTLAATGTTTTSTTLGWVGGGSATDWSIEYGPRGFIPGTGTFVSVSGTASQALSGLTPNTFYDYYVRTICSSADSSTKTGPFSFVTAQIPATPPYAQNWETGGTDWTLYNGTQPNIWTVGTATSNNGTNSLYVSSDAGVTNGYNINSPSIVHAFRDFDFTGVTGTIPVTFYWKAMGEPLYDYLRVWVAPLTFMPTPQEAILASATVVQINPTELSSQAAFVPAFLSIPASYAGTTARLIFEWTNDTNTGTQTPAAVDNLTVGGNPLSPSPLNKIEAANIGTRNRIKWNTISEDEGDRMIVERSKDGKSFSDLATIATKGEASHYTYWDETPFTGINYYRIRLVDASGAATWSATVSATVKGTGFSLQAFPNPVADVLTVRATGTISSEANLLIMDLTGKTIRSVTMTIGEASVDMSGMAKGTYLIRYNDANNTRTIKVTKH